MFFKDYFEVFRTMHNTSGRGKNLMLPKVRTETVRKSCYFKGSKLFNDIPNEMKDLNSIMIFKTCILEFYRSQASKLLLNLVAVFRLFKVLLPLQGPY